MEKCLFCLADVKKLHPRSHTMPEWGHRLIYNEKNRAVRISLENEVAHTIKQGEAKPFLCSACEECFAKDDHYGSLVIGNRSPGGAEKMGLRRAQYPPGTNKATAFLGFNFIKLQKFVFSLVIREELSRKVDNLSPKLIERDYQGIKTLYLDNSKSDDETYLIHFAEFHQDDTMRNIIVPPYQDKVDGHFCIRVAIAGFFFTIYTSKHSKDKHIQESRLKKDGSAIGVHLYVQECRFFKNSEPRLRNIVNRQGLSLKPFKRKS